MSTIVKHIIGWHDASNMTNPGYLEHWITKVNDEQLEGNEVIVISVPKGEGFPELIERFLQENIK